jgi:hypothetical protein
VTVLRLELVRLLGWRRWAAAAVVLAAVGWVIGEETVSRAMNEDFGVNQWDVPLEVLNNSVIVFLVIVPLFVGIVGDVVGGDRRTRYAIFTLPRVQSRDRWWLAKVAAVVITSFLYFAVAVGILSLIGVLMTSPSWGLSEYGSALPDPLGTPAEAASFYGPPPIANGLGVLVVGGYTAIATAAFAALVLAVANAWTKAWVPMLIAIGAVLIGFAIQPTNAFHPFLHFFWDVHSFAYSDTAVTWSASALVLAVQFVVSVLTGALVLRHVDI